VFDFLPNEQVRKVPELITMNAFGLLVEPTDELGLFMREVLMKHLDFTVRLPRPDLFTTAFDAAYEARCVRVCVRCRPRPACVVVLARDSPIHPPH
jgi:hypothetical protein